MALESMRIVTGCKTPQQFVAVFHRFCDATTCFIPTTDTRPVGSALSFTLRLVDGTPMLSGTCVVKAAWPSKENAFNRPGVQLQIEKLSEDSEALFEQMLSQKTVVEPTRAGVVETVKPVTTNQLTPRDDKALERLVRQGTPVVTIPVKDAAVPDRTQTEEMAPLESPEQDVVMATVQMPPLVDERRAPGSAFVLPANPLSDLADADLDTMLGCTLADDGVPLPEEEGLAIPVTERTAVPRDSLATVLGVAPLEKVKTKRKTEASPVALREEAVPVATLDPLGGTARLAFDSRPPAAPSMFRLRAMTSEERFWYLCALGAALFVAALVLMTTLVFAR